MQEHAECEMTWKDADSNIALLLSITLEWMWSCCVCGAGAWVRGSADDTPAGPFSAFAFYSQSAHLSLSDITHVKR